MEKEHCSLLHWSFTPPIISVPVEGGRPPSLQVRPPFCLEEQPIFQGADVHILAQAGHAQTEGIHGVFGRQFRAEFSDLSANRKPTKFSKSS